ncbi:MAG: hypothetical protein SFU98_05570 [Leptospiraceae bacterium]|nr:hypothetical protein [Leptospiraceae bacterium]
MKVIVKYISFQDKIITNIFKLLLPFLILVQANCLQKSLLFRAEKVRMEDTFEITNKNRFIVTICKDYMKQPFSQAKEKVFTYLMEKDKSIKGFKNVEMIVYWDKCTEISYEKDFHEK